MTTRTLVFLIPLLMLGCGGDPKGDGSDGASSTVDTSAGEATVTPTTTAGSASGTGTATDSSDPSGDPSGNPTGNPSGDPTGNPTSDSEGPTSATLTTSSETDGCANTPVFETDIIPILNASCGAGDNACHSRVAYAADANANCRGWLALEDAPLGAAYYSGPMEGQPTGCSDMDLYTRLIQLDAWQCEQFDPRVKYVVPCKPEESYMIHKMDGGPYCMLAENMPSQPMPLGKPVDPAERELLRAWIAAGAPRLGDPCPIDCDGPDPSTGTDTGTDTGTTDPDAKDPPVAQINHPGDGENRPVNVDIPFVGFANDPQDGMIPANKLVWTSDLEGQIGVGDNFNAPLTMVGMHTITLTATDIDGNEGTDSLVLNMQ